MLFVCMKKQEYCTVYLVDAFSGIGIVLALLPMVDGF